jgi:Flp pilus assembly protein CpaB
MRAATHLAGVVLVVTLSSVSVAEDPRPLDFVTVYVARREIVQGTYFKDPERFFKPVRYVKGDEPRDAVTSLEQIKGMRSARSLAEDQPVKGKDLLRPEGSPLRLPHGLRAMAVKVVLTDKQKETLLPNCRVDVVSTTKTEDGQSMSLVIVKNVLVLAVDSVPLGDKRKALPVTLEVTGEEAQKLALGSQQATLTLVLRPAAKPKPAPSKKAPAAPVPCSGQK